MALFTSLFWGLFTWPNQDDWMNMTKPWQRWTLINNWTWLKLKPTNLKFTSGVLLNLRAWYLFLVEERSNGLARLGRCPSQCKLGNFNFWFIYPKNHFKKGLQVWLPGLILSAVFTLFDTKVHFWLNSYLDLHHLQGVWNLPHKFHLYLIYSLEFRV